MWRCCESNANSLCVSRFRPVSEIGAEWGNLYFAFYLIDFRVSRIKMEVKQNYGNIIHGGICVSNSEKIPSFSRHHISGSRAPFKGKLTQEGLKNDVKNTDTPLKG